MFPSTPFQERAWEHTAGAVVRGTWARSKGGKVERAAASFYNIRVTAARMHTGALTSLVAVLAKQGFLRGILQCQGPVDDFFGDGVETSFTRIHVLRALYLLPSCGERKVVKQMGQHL